MVKVRASALLAASALLLSQTFAFGQQVDISSLIQGKGLAPSFKLSELPPEYKACKIELAKGSGDALSSIMPLMLMGPSTSAMSGNGGAMLLSASLLGSYWTKAETVKMGGFDYLVTYRLEPGLRKGGGEGNPLSMTLRLNLIRSDMIASFSPDPNAKITDIIAFLDQAKIPYDEPVDQLNMQPQTMTSAAVLYPVFAQAKDAARRTSTLSNAKQLAVGAMIYMTDYDDVMPYVQGTAAAKYVLDPYLKNPGLWKSLNPNGGEFKLNMAVAGVNVAAVDNPAEVVLFYEEKEWPDGKRCVAYLDSHARVLDREGWEKAKATLKAKYKKTGRPLPMDYGK